MALHPKHHKAIAAQKVDSISIESNLTVDGTVLKIDGTVIDNVSHIQLFQYDDAYGRYLGMSYTVSDKPGSVDSGDFREEHVYRLNGPKSNSDAFAEAQAEFAATGNTEKIRDYYKNEFGTGIR